MNDQSKYQDSEWIDAYLLDELSESQKRAFEEELAENNELKEKVDAYRAVKDGVEASGREELKERLKALEERVTRESKSSKKTMAWYSSRIAAVLILFILPLYFILSNLNEVDSEEVFASHFKPYPVLANGTVRGDAADGPLSEGLRAYQNGDYTLAITKLENIKKRDEGFSNGRFYLALSHLANEDAVQAIPVLGALAEDDEFKLNEQAKWYLGLAFLRNDQPDKARDTFQELYETTQDSTFKVKAQNVLDEL